MQNGKIDILMVTYNRPDYAQLSLSRLLDSCDESMRVWLWHNGNHREALEVTREFANHKNVYRFFHSPENRKLREPTNWLWREADGEYLSKVDDDCLVPDGWAHKLRQAHDDVKEFGVIGCWKFMEEDFVPEVASKKIRRFCNAHEVLQNFWIGGSGYVMKRECVERHGVLGARESFTDYCIRLARHGWINGWYHPLVVMEHMDDPRSPHSALRNDQDLRERLPLSAALYQGEATTLASWAEGQKRMARSVQLASIDPRDYAPWRLFMKRVHNRLGRMVSPALSAARPSN